PGRGRQCRSRRYARGVQQAAEHPPPAPLRFPPPDAAGVRRAADERGEPDLSLRQACVLRDRPRGRRTLPEDPAQPARSARSAGSAQSVEGVRREVKHARLAASLVLALLLPLAVAAAPDFAALDVQKYDPPKPAP